MSRRQRYNTAPSAESCPLPPVHPLLKPWLYLALPALIMLVFFFFPLLAALLMSAMDFSDFNHIHWIGLQNYHALMQMPLFWSSLNNTLYLMLLIVPLMVILPLPMAVLANQQLKGIKLLRLVIYFPVIVSVVVAAIVWKWLYAEQGLFNGLIQQLNHQFHWHIQPIGWLTTMDWVLPAIAIMVVWKGAAYYMMMYLASLQSVNQQLYEAAQVDGANFWRMHQVVTLPHLKSTVALVAIVSSIGVLKLFGEIYVMTQGGPLQSSTTLVYSVYEKAFGQLDLGIACTLGVVLMLIILCISSAQLFGFYLREERKHAAHH